MLLNEKNDLLYLINILEYIGKIWKYTEGINNEDELYEKNEQMNFNASITLLANIGENISKVPDKLKSENKNINWIEIKNFRNKIVHDYGGIDLLVVYEIISNDLGKLKQEVERIIKEKTIQKIFDIEEIEICKESNFYKYINFKNLI